MIPSLNHVLFYITTFFAINGYFFSKESILTLDFKKKTIEIEYLMLQTGERAVPYAADGLKELLEKKQIKEVYAESIRLVKKDIFKKEGNLHARLKFSFQNKEDALKLLNIRVNNEGNFEYHLFVNEELVLSNGKNISNRKTIEWDKNTKKITLQLKDTQSNGVNVASYWKE